MEKRILGRTGLEVTPLGFGGAEIGFEAASQETVKKLLNAALDAGLNVIDTAECYLNSEELIGAAVAGRRADFHLFTKCGHASGINLPDWDLKLLKQTIDRSLRNLQTDHVDLLQLHSCSEELLRRGDVTRVLQDARAAGKTRFIGYSGDAAAAKFAVECGDFDTLQTSLSIADQQALTLTLPLARDRNIGVIVKRPIANAAWRTGRKPDNAYHHVYWDRLQKLDYDFIKADPAAAVATALRFTLGSPGVHTAIVGTTHPDRWKQNAAVVEQGPLPEAEVAAIRRRWTEVAKVDWVGQT